MKDPAMQDFALARRAMIDSQLRPQGVTDRTVLEAMATVPREEFVPAEARAFAYFDRAIPVAGRGAMMPPTPLGQLLATAAPKPGERALVIGAAPGYAAALLEAIGLTVTQGDSAGPVDLLLVEGAIDLLPDTLAEALVEGGRIATALVSDGSTRLAIGRKFGGVIGWNRFADADIAPLAGFARPPAFTF
ncbi:MAG: protein-L-isoaspartate O-methyltransferase [Sphingomicrobium sp.]